MLSVESWMRSSRVIREYDNAIVVTVLGSVSAYSTPALWNLRGGR
jgi:hypothetical protein